MDLLHLSERPATHLVHTHMQNTYALFCLFLRRERKTIFNWKPCPVSFSIHVFSQPTSIPSLTHLYHSTHVLVQFPPFSLSTEGHACFGIGEDQPLRKLQYTQTWAHQLTIQCSQSTGCTLVQMLHRYNNRFMRNAEKRRIADTRRWRKVGCRHKPRPTIVFHLLGWSFIQNFLPSFPVASKAQQLLFLEAEAIWSHFWGRQKYSSACRSTWGLKSTSVSPQGCTSNLLFSFPVTSVPTGMNLWPEKEKWFCLKWWSLSSSHYLNTVVMWHILSGSSTTRNILSGSCGCISAASRSCFVGCADWTWRRVGWPTGGSGILCGQSPQLTHTLDMCMPSALDTRWHHASPVKDGIDLMHACRYCKLCLLKWQHDIICDVNEWHSPILIINIYKAQTSNIKTYFHDGITTEHVRLL